MRTPESRKAVNIHPTNTIASEVTLLSLLDKFQKWTKWHPLVFLALIFFTSRLFYYKFMGIRVDYEIVLYATISVDPVFLREQFWTTLYSIHSSPPLFQLVMSGIMAAFPSAAVPIYFVLYTILGVALMAGLYRLLLALGVGFWWSLAITAVFISSPQVMLYEAWLYNTYPVCVLLVWSCVIVSRIAKEPTTRNFVSFFAVLASLALIRQIYHVLWIVIFVVFWVAARPDRWRSVIVGAIVPLVIVGAVYAKNYVAFGSFAGSSWSGLYLSRVTVFQLSDEDRRAMIADGILSPLADMNPFARPSQYRGRIEFPPETGALLLDRELWETSNARYGEPIPNYNHRIYPIVSRIRLRDAISTIMHRPDIFGLTILKSIKVFLRSPIQDSHVSFANRTTMPTLEAIADIILYLQVPRPILELLRGHPGGEFVFRALHQTSFTILGIYAVMMIFMLLQIRRFNMKRLRTQPSYTLFAYAALQIGFITLVYLTLENGENSRFRFEIEPILLAFSVAALIRLFRICGRARISPKRIEIHP